MLTAEDVARRIYEAHRSLVAASPYRAVMLQLSPYAGLIRPFLQSWGFRPPNVGRPAPDGTELANMIEAFTWLVFLPGPPSPAHDIVALRSRAHPETGAPTSWAKIATVTRSSSYIAQKMHAEAMDTIAARLANRVPESAVCDAKRAAEIQFS